jgi:hypothetical protein
MAELFPRVPDFDCFREYEHAPEIVPGRSERDWMDITTQRFAYRCTPLPIANASGWEVILPASFTASWNGGPLPRDVTLQWSDSDNRLKSVVEPVFGHGILTFHPGYLAPHRAGPFSRAALRTRSRTESSLLKGSWKQTGCHLHLQ